MQAACSVLVGDEPLHSSLPPLLPPSLGRHTHRVSMSVRL